MINESTGNDSRWLSEINEDPALCCHFSLFSMPIHYFIVITYLSSPFHIC